MKVIGFPNIFANLSDEPPYTRPSHIDQLRKIAAFQWRVDQSEIETRQITGDNGYFAVEFSLKKAA